MFRFAFYDSDLGLRVENELGDANRNWKRDSKTGQEVLAVVCEGDDSDLD